MRPQGDVTMADVAATAVTRVSSTRNTMRERRLRQDEVQADLPGAGTDGAKITYDGSGWRPY